MTFDELIRETIRFEVRAEVARQINQSRTPEEARLKKGWSVDQLSERAGVGGMTIRRIEQGIVKNLRPETLQKIGLALGRADYSALAVAKRKI